MNINPDPRYNPHKQKRWLLHQRLLVMKFFPYRESDKEKGEAIAGSAIPAAFSPRVAGGYFHSSTLVRAHGPGAAVFF